MLIIRLGLLGLGAVFAVEALGKIASWESHGGSIFGDLPLGMAVGLVGLELVLAAALVLSIRPLIGLTVSIFLLSAFTGVLLAEYPRDKPRSCGCGGSEVVATPKSSELVRAELRFGIARNGLLLLGSTILMISMIPRARANDAEPGSVGGREELEGEPRVPTTTL